MMPRIERRYTAPLTDVDRIKTRQLRNGGVVLEYSVQYEALINGRWRKVTRFDNAHGSSPHRHVYYPYQPEYKYPMNARDNNHAFTQAQQTIKTSFQQMRESYILLIEKGGR